jgi:hypothetical protein
MNISPHEFMIIIKPFVLLYTAGVLLVWSYIVRSGIWKASRWCVMERFFWNVTILSSWLAVVLYLYAIYFGSNFHKRLSKWSRCFRRPITKAFVRHHRFWWKERTIKYPVLRNKLRTYNPTPGTVDILEGCEDS